MRAVRSPVLPAVLVVLSLALTGIGEAGQLSYRIGPSDILSVSVWDNKDLDQVVFVRSDGKISLPLLGKFRPATSRSPSWRPRLGERVVYGQGEVKSPGLIEFTDDLTILRAIAHAGGFTNLAASRRVSLLRGDSLKKEKIQVDVYQV